MGKVKKPRLLPVAVTINLCVAEVEGGMSAMWDRLNEALDAIPGVFSEGGSSREMPADEVIPDSPLAKYMEAGGDA